MKIFNRGESKQKAEAPPAPPESVPVEVAPPAPAPPQPDLTAIIDANVKEMSEKIARLASTIESEHSDRADFEAKLEKMEERMRKLSSLTEMISAQYNPFVGSAPTEREPMPQPEVGLAMPPAALPPPIAVVPIEAAPLEPPMAEAPPLPAFDAFAGIVDAPPVEAVEPPEAAPAPPPPEPQPVAAEERALARLWSVPPGFAASSLVLKWADMLLRSASGRDALVSLVDYYHNIGWIGDPARDQLLAYADGLASSANAPSGTDWRADMDLHEKSLLYVEKLRALAGSRGD